MAMIREKNLICREHNLNWKSDNGIWQIIAKTEIEDDGFVHRSINIFRRHDSGQMVLHPIGKYRKITPKFVLAKYDEMHDVIRGRVNNG